MSACKLFYQGEFYDSLDQVKVKIRESNQQTAFPEMASQTFESIASFPHFSTQEAVTAYAFTQTPQFNKEFGEGETITTAFSERINKAASVIAKGMTSPEIKFRGRDGKLTSMKSESAPYSHVFLTDGGIEVDLTEASKVMEENGEPRLLFQSSQGNVFTTYYDALSDSANGTMSVGFVSPRNRITTEGNKINGVAPNQFITIATVDVELSPNTPQGFINHAIRKGLLSDQSVFNGEEWVLVGYGENTTEQAYNANLLVAEAETVWGANRVGLRADDSVMISTRKVGITEVLDREGNPIEMDDAEVVKELEKGNFRKIEKKMKDALSYAIGVWQKYHPMFDTQHEIKNTQTDRPAPRSEDELKIMLLDNLNALGIKVTTISNYLEAYKTKHNKDLDVQGLADLANKVVALAEGTIDPEVLAEELSHFAIEGFEDQDAVDSVEMEVETTAEWAEHSAYYYSLYKNQAKGEALDKLVRREIIGKVLKRKIKENFNRVQGETQSTAFFSTIRDMWRSFVNKIQAAFRPQNRQNLDLLLDEIAELIVNKQLVDYFDDSLLQENDYIMYSKETQWLIDKLDTALESISETMQGLRRGESSLPNILSTTIRDASNSLDLVKGLETQLEDPNLSQQQIDLLKEEYALNSKKLTISVVGMVDSIVSAVESKYKNLGAIDSTTDINITPEDISLNNLIKDEYIPVLTEMEVSMRNDTEIWSNEEVEYHSNLITDVRQRAEGIGVLIGRTAHMQAEGYVREFGRKNNLSESEIQAMLAKINSDTSDTNWLMRKYGYLEYASNPLLRILGTLVHQFNHRGKVKYLRFADTFLKKVESEKWKKTDFERLIQRDKNGNFTRFTQSMYKFAEYEADLHKAQYEAYVKATGETISFEDYSKVMRGKSAFEKVTINGVETKQQIKVKKMSEMTDDQIAVYNKTMADWKKEGGVTRRFLNEYYDEKETRYDKIEVKTISGETRKVSKETKAFLDDISAKRARIQNKYRIGRFIDFDSMTPEDVSNLRFLHMSRRNAKAMVDAATMEYKTGIDLTIAEDLQAIDESYRNDPNNKNKVIKQEFWNNFYTAINIQKGASASQQEINERMMKALLLHGGLSFTDAYWEDISNSYKSRVETVRETIQRVTGYVSDDMLDRLQELEVNLIARSEILKKYNDPSNPVEYVIDDMSSQDRTRLFEIEDTITQINEVVNSVIEAHGESEAEIERETTMNEAYHSALKSSGITEITFLTKHMASRSREQFNKFMGSIAQYRSGTRDLARFVQRFLEEKQIEPESLRGMTQAELDSLYIMYGQKMVMPYFKRTAPKGYTAFMEGLKDGTYDIQELIDSSRGHLDPSAVKRVYPENSPLYVLNYMTVTPNYMYFEQTNLENPDYIKDFEGGIQQPGERYIDHDYLNHYGIDLEEFRRTGVEKATRNTNDFEMLQLLRDMKREGLEQYNLTGRANVHELPGVTKTVLEKGATFLEQPLATLENTARDILTDRMDELSYGTRDGRKNIFGDTNLIMPNYYVDRLENDADYAHELTFSYSMFLSEAFKYTEKQRILPEILTYQQRVYDQTYGGKKGGTDTNNYKMFKEAVDAYFFGVKRNRKWSITIGNVEFDIGKLFTTFNNKIVKVANIGGSPAIALTSFTTAGASFWIEAALGEHIQKDSLVFAHKEFTKHGLSMVPEAGAVHRTNPMYTLMEFFGIKDEADKVRNSGFSKFFRVFNSPLYAGLELGDLPLGAGVTISVLHDLRVHNGRIYSFNEFKRLDENRGKPKKDVEAAWKNIESTNLYNNIELKDGVYEFKEGLLDKSQFESKSEYVEYQDNILRRASNKIIALKSNIDAVQRPDDRMAASRDHILNFTINHRSWFTTYVQRALQHEQTNFRTGEIEKGWLRTGKDVTFELFTSMLKNPIDTLLTIRTFWDTMSDVDKLNTQRLVYHTGVLLGLALIGAGLAAIVDDDREKKTEEPLSTTFQLFAYVGFRTINEVASIHPVMGVIQTVDMLNSPFVAMNSIRELTDFGNWSLDRIQRGTYEGHTKLYRMLVKQTSLRHYYDMMGIADKSRYYRVINANTLFWAGLNGAKKEVDEEGEEWEKEQSKWNSLIWGFQPEAQSYGWEMTKR